ncbi:MAG: ABC transporter permease [bacterium]|nr:ABC transporter permease [bacterium]
MHDAIQVVVDAAAIGCVYSLIAIGFTMMLRASDLINFAQGEMVMLGAYIGFTIATLAPLPYPAIFLLTAAALFGVGLVMDRTIVRPILKRGSPVLNLIIATVGISVALRAIAIILWGGYPLRMPNARLFGPVHVAGVTLASESLLVIFFGVATMAALQWFFQRTISGIAWRAVAMDAETARLMGVSTDRTTALTFGIASALGGAAGVLLAPLYNISVGLGGIAIKSFAASAIGGFTLGGSMLGGIALGLLETLTTRYLSSAYKDVVSYGLLIVILLLFYRAKAPAGRSAAQRATRAVGMRAGIAFAPLSRYRNILFALALGAFVAVPHLVSGTYTLRIINEALIMAIAAIGLQVIIGYTGQLSLGHAAFMAIGAYTSVLLVRVGVPWPVTVLAAVLASAALSRIVAPILRLSGHYLAIGTLALGQIVVMLLINLSWITNGAYGISNIPAPRFGGLVIDTQARYFYLLVIVFIALYIALSRLLSSRFGRALVALRENELAAVCAGVDSLGYRTKAFVIGCACAGVAGAVYGPFVSLINPDAFTLDLSISFLIMVVLGGLGSLPGAVLGAIIVTLVPEYFRALGAWRLVLYGGAIISFMVLLPGGVLDLIRLPAFAFRSWRRLVASRNASAQSAVRDRADVGS